MSVRSVRLHATRWGARHTALLTGVSVAALLMAAPHAVARPLNGAPQLTPSAAAIAAAQSGSAEAVRAARAAQNSLKRATMAIQAQQASQNAARDAARLQLQRTPSDIAHGLTTPAGQQISGLQVAPGATPGSALWQGANLPTEFNDGDRVKVTVEQTQQKALLTWQTFNVSERTDLRFDQKGNRDWVALNRVLDNSAPSRILGSITGDGSVYVINRNGIIFGGTSQINVGTLVASALPINEALWNAGILYGNPDARFTFSAYGTAEGTAGPTDAFIAPAATAASQTSQIIVEPGARISTTTTPDHNGGRVILIGPHVTNRGTIFTPDGQTILAAGQQVGLLAHPSDDPSLRGLDAFVGDVRAPEIGFDAPSLASPTSISSIVTGTATNAGIIEAPRGNITITGATVRNLGVLDSTTSVSLNGRIDLLAQYNASGSAADSNRPPQFSAAKAGIVILDANSLTRILPEVDSDETIVGTSLALPSQINITGQTTYFGRNSHVLAPSAKVTVTAVELGVDSGTPQNAQIYLDTGATIDVSGSIVQRPVSDNILTAQLLGPELADSPLQRRGFLYGKTITVDIRQTGTRQDGSTWIGTPLADISGHVALMKRTVGELTTSGGSIAFNSNASVVMQPGSAVNVSNGWIAYQGGIVPSTTRLLSAGGVIYDISRASPDLVYVGFGGGWTRSNARWNVTETWTSPLSRVNTYQPGYVHGGAGGTLDIRVPVVSLGGELLGGVVSGQRQRSVAPSASTFSLLLQKPNLEFNELLPSVTQEVIFQANVAPQAAAPLDLNDLTLDPDRPIYVSPDIVGETGFGKVSVTSSNGDIRVLSGLTGTARSSLTLTGKNIDVAANILLPGGTISLSTVALDPSIGRNNDAPILPGDIAGRGQLTLHAGAVLSTSGLIVDDRGGSTGASPLAINGGSISLTSFHLDLQDGSVIDVSGGANLRSGGKLTAGNAGSISLRGGGTSRPIDIDPNDPTDEYVRSNLTLAAELRGYAIGKGGRLSLSLPRFIQIGGTTIDQDTYLFSPDFFDRGGFADFSLSGVTVNVAPDTVIAPTVQSYALDVVAGNIALKPVLLPDALRSPVSLTFNASGIADGSGFELIRGDFVLAETASIRLAPTINGTGVVRINQGDNVNATAILGSIIVPGGQINVAGHAAHKPVIGGGVEIVLGERSLLSTAGTTVLIPNAAGRRTGKALDGGIINIDGNLLAEAGAVIDVSGTRGEFDIAGEGLVRWQQTQVIESNGGTLNLVLGQGNVRYSAATLLGRAGGSSARGGTFAMGGALVTQELNTGISHEHGLDALSSNVDNGALPRQGYFAIDTLAGSGFDALAFGELAFSGPVNIAARHSIVVNGIQADNAVALSASYVALGGVYLGGSNGSGSQGTISAFFGPGSLSVTASLIDVGSIDLKNIGTAHLNANGGDIRGYGTLAIAGDITLTAGQIYPAMASTFTIAALDHDGVPGSITINAGGSRGLPLSAGGTLNIFASEINQNGVLRAPFGTINLGSKTGGEGFGVTTRVSLGAGSITSVSGVDPVTGKVLILPYGTQLNGENWLDPLGNDISLGGAPQKTIRLSGEAVEIGEGATLDLSGGGELFSYNWVKGIGGSKDILASSDSFAILPGYDGVAAPPTTLLTRTSLEATLKSAASGWSNNALAVGDRVWLDASSGLPAGYYTLLPARFALLPGAYLVTPRGQAGSSGVSVPMSDGSSIVSGYRGNGLTGSRDQLPTMFAVASNAVVRARAQYDLYAASVTLRDSALAGDVVPPRLPIDAGQLVLSASRTMDIRGRARMNAPQGGLGGLVDISAPNSIVINDTGTGTAADTLYLNAGNLSAFGAESLLIGGVRNNTADGLVITTTTTNIEVANTAANGLYGPEIILASKDNLFVNADAVVEQRGTLSSPAESLLLGNITGSLSFTSGGQPRVQQFVLGGSTSALNVERDYKLTFTAGLPAGAFRSSAHFTVTFAGVSTDYADGELLPEIAAGSIITFRSSGALTLNAGGNSYGNGALVRVTSDVSAQVARVGVVPGLSGNLAIGAGARIAGAGVILDSTGSTTFDPTAQLSGSAVTLGGAQVSLQLDNPGALQSAGGLVLPGTLLTSLQSTIKSLSLLSYSTIDIYGTGAIGAVDASGKPVVDTLAFRSGGLRGFNSNGGTATFNAKHVLIDNSPNVAAAAAVTGVNDLPSGTLVFNTEILEAGKNNANIVGYADVNVVATGGVLLNSAGSLGTVGNLTVATAEITGGAKSKQTLSAGNVLTVNATGTESTLTRSLGADITLAGARVVMNSVITLPSGFVTLRATGTAPGSDVVVGGTIEVGGAAQAFHDQTRYTNGGKVALTSDHGNVDLTAASTISVAAAAAAGNAGTLVVSATEGTFNVSGALKGSAGEGGKSGVFALDVGSQPTTAAVNARLDAGQFNEARAFRVRTGNVVMDGTAKANNFVLAADAGAITVTGTIDASGVTGGQIGLYGYNGVTLANGALLTVAAEKLDAAGKGGTVEIEAGQAKEIGGVMTPGVGWIDLQTGSVIDLSAAGGTGGTLHLRAPQITGTDGAGNPIPTVVDSVAGGSDVAIKPLNGTIRNASSVVVEGFQVFDLTPVSGTIDDTVKANVDANAQAFTANTAAITDRLLDGTPNAGLGDKFHVQPGEELVSRAALPLTLDTAGSTINIAAGTSVSFANGVSAGNVVTFSASGRITHADGSTTMFSADTPVTLAAGDSVVLDAAGVLTFASGTDPIDLTVNGLVTTTTGAGTTTTLTAGATGMGFSLNSSGSISLGAGRALTFTSDLPTGSTITATTTGTLTIPAGLSGTATLLPGGSTTLGAATNFILPADGSISVNGTIAVRGEGTMVVLTNGQTIKTSYAGTQAFGRIPFALGTGSGLGGTDISGDALMVTYSGSAPRFTATSGGRIVNPSNTSSGTNFNAGAAVGVTTTNRLIILNEPGTVTFTQNQHTGTYTYRSTVGNQLAFELIGSASVINYTSFTGRITNLGAATVTGTIQLFGPTPLNLALIPGNNAIGQGLVLKSIPAGSRFTPSDVSILSLAGSNPLSLNMDAGAFAVTGAMGVAASGDMMLPSTWDFAGLRYGPAVNPSIAGSGEPGVLTLRSSGNLVLNGSLTDGFLSGTNVLLPAGAQSWSYRLVAGADLGSANFREVTPLAKLPDNTGSILLGIPNLACSVTACTTTDAAKAGSDQLIRTGTGSIDIAAGRDVQIRSQFSTIYTAGSRVTPGGATDAILNPGGTVDVRANIPVQFPGGTSGSITSTVDGLVTITNPVSDLVLPLGTVYSFPTGAFVPGTNATHVSFSALQAELSVPTAATLAFPNLTDASISGFAPGATVYFTSISSGSPVLTPSSSGILYMNAGSGVFNPVQFAAGAPLPSMSPGSYFILSNGGTLTQSGSGSMKVTITGGVYNLTSPSKAAASDRFGFSYLPYGTTLRALDVDGGAVNGNAKFIATVPLPRNTPFVLPANSAVSLPSDGVLSLDGGMAVALRQPALGADGKTYLFDTPIPSNDLNIGTGAGANNVLGTTPYPLTTPQYSTGGGNVTVAAGRDIIHLGMNGVDDSSQQMPVNWLYRRSSVANGVFTRGYSGDMSSTTWWVDFSNFFEGIGTLGGGNLTMTAGRDVKNVDGVAPTNAWMPYATVAANGAVDNRAATQPLFEYGGGNLVVTSGRDINAGIYYVEKGQGTLSAGGSILTNATRTATIDALSAANYSGDLSDWLPTTLFLGKGSFRISAYGDLLLGSVSNPFLLPQGVMNGAWARSYFSTYEASNSVSVSSLTGNITLRADTSSGDGRVVGSQTPTYSVGPGTLSAWFSYVLPYPRNPSGNNTVGEFRPWLRLTELNLPRAISVTATQAVISSGSTSGGGSGVLGGIFHGAIGLMPPTLVGTSFSGDINITGQITLAPAALGTLDLMAAGAIQGFQEANSLRRFTGGSINLSDIDPNLIPGIRSPMALDFVAGSSVPLVQGSFAAATPLVSARAFNALFDETGATKGTDARSSRQQSLHDSDLLHRDDPDPLRVYAGSGNISGLTVFSPKRAQILAGHDIAEAGFYLQNLEAGDVSQVIAGRDLKVASDISIGGPGTLQVLAGRNLNLGFVGEVAGAAADGTKLGIVSIGNARNPYLPFDQGADIVAAAGLGMPSGPGLAGSKADFSAFIAAFLDPASGGVQTTRYLPELGAMLGVGADSAAVWAAFQQLPQERRNKFALNVFYLVLRDAGRDHNDPGAPNGQRNYEWGYDAIAKLFPGNAWQGDISLSSRLIRTESGGDINILAPGGELFVGLDLGDKQPLDQGIMTLSRGNISIFTKHNVSVGTSRIFTFRGGNEIIWSTEGNIAAGSAAKTVQSAPPARYLIDPDTGTSLLDLAGLATGGGIGVLQTRADVPTGNVDLIAPSGFIDAGDAGIRSSGNINVAALQIINAFNIQAQGTAVGIPTVQAPNISGALTASSATAASQQVATPTTANANPQPSVIIVEVIGFGGGDGSGDAPNDDERERRRRIDRQSQDPRSRVQILDAGALTTAQRRELVEERRQLLGQ